MSSLQCFLSSIVKRIPSFSLQPSDNPGMLTTVQWTGSPKAPPPPHNLLATCLLLFFQPSVKCKRGPCSCSPAHKRPNFNFSSESCLLCYHSIQGETLRSPNVPNGFKSILSQIPCYQTSLVLNLLFCKMGLYSLSHRAVVWNKRNNGQVFRMVLVFVCT